MKFLNFITEGRLNIFIALLSLIVAITFGIFQFRPKLREITCNVTSSNELTSISQVPNLTSEFTYNQKKVTHLWKLTLVLINTGNETIVGEGQHSLLIKGGIYLGFPENTEILNIEPPDGNLPLTVEIVQPNIFVIKFPQWKQDERANLSIYVASQIEQQTPLLPQVMSRDIVDGSVLVTNNTNPISPPKNLIERLPVWGQILIKVLLSFLCGIATILGFYALPDDVITYIRFKRWRDRHGEGFNTFVNQQSDLSDERKEYYRRNPQLFPNDKLNTFTGNKPPKNYSYYSSIWTAILTLLLSLLVGSASTFYILSNLFELYFAFFS